LYDVKLLLLIVGSQNLEIATLSKQFGREDVTVTLLLTEFDSLYSYNISAIPQLISHNIFNESIMHMVQIEVYYNIHYNVSILAESFCGKSNLANFTEVYFGEQKLKTLLL
jgi:hypothetical protein